MEKTKFTTETYNDYITRTLDNLRNDELSSLEISTMNLFAKENTLMHNFLSEMSRSNKKALGKFVVYHDVAYMQRMLVMPDGHYVFQRSVPWDVGKKEQKTAAREVRDRNLEEFSDILVNLPARFYQTETDTNFWKKSASSHLFQHLAASHVKAAVKHNKNGSIETAIQTGELSSASQQNNLSLTILNNKKAAKFVEKVINPETKIGSNLFDVENIALNINLAADYGNYGSPKSISYIHELAETMINPSYKSPVVDNETADAKPTSVILVSQYVPSGRILKALRFAADPKNYGARVVVPLEPDDDYRRSEIGFKILDKHFALHRGKHVLTPVRPISSHSKCLITAYDDGSLAMIFGSDNFDSTSDRFYRNTELSLCVNRVKKDENGYDMIISMLKKLVEEREIDQSEFDRIVKK